MWKKWEELSSKEDPVFNRSVVVKLYRIDQIFFYYWTDKIFFSNFSVSCAPRLTYICTTHVSRTLPWNLKSWVSEANSFIVIPLIKGPKIKTRQVINIFYYHIVKYLKCFIMVSGKHFFSKISKLT